MVNGVLLWLEREREGCDSEIIVAVAGARASREVGFGVSKRVGGVLSAYVRFTAS
jgi:hypothetical protein